MVAKGEMRIKKSNGDSRREAERQRGKVHMKCIHIRWLVLWVWTSTTMDCEARAEVIAITTKYQLDSFPSLTYACGSNAAAISSYDLCDCLTVVSDPKSTYASFTFPSPLTLY